MQVQVKHSAQLYQCQVNMLLGCGDDTCLRIRSSKGVLLQLHWSLSEGVVLPLM